MVDSPTQPVASGVHVQRVAATVVLLRDTAAGPEVLMLERPHSRGAFAGAWVFPGGSVDVDDGLTSVPGESVTEGEEAAARRAAVREVAEETSLTVATDALVCTACWTPPPSEPRRFRTWFYYAAAPDGAVVLSPYESVDSRWIRPADALELHAAGELSLVPPTWVTLSTLTADATAEDALARASQAEPDEFATHLSKRDDGVVYLWRGDVAYNDRRLIDAVGSRHRLDARTVPWRYDRSDTE